MKYNDQSINRKKKEESKQSNISFLFVFDYNEWGDEDKDGNDENKLMRYKSLISLLLIWLIIGRSNFEHPVIYARQQIGIFFIDKFFQTWTEIRLMIMSLMTSCPYWQREVIIEATFI